MTNHQPRILIVDDLPDWRKTLMGLLTDEGYGVEETDSLHSALDILKDNRFDLVVADIRLDESDKNNTDGVTLARGIKEQWPDVKVILITGYDTQEILEQAMAPNPQGKSLVENFIPKTETDKLPAIVLHVLGR